MSNSLEGMQAEIAARKRATSINDLPGGVDNPHPGIPAERHITAEDRQQFRDQLMIAYAASEGDSNDAEIDALWDLAAIACGILNVWRDDGEESN